MPQFGGASEKCGVCIKTVYLTEKIVVEDKEDRKTFHKNCLRCSHCNVVISLGNYASMNGVFYCKPHFKQLFATKGNYDEGFGKTKHTEKWTPQASSAPSTFVPVEKDGDKPSEKKDTPSSIASKFSSVGSAAEKCETCQKTVYATEKMVIEEKEGKKVFHKLCFKCTHCSVVMSLGNFASMNSVYYCKPHFKQLFATKGNYDEGFGKEKRTANWTPVASSTPSTFVPVQSSEVSKEKKESSSGVASRFKGITNSEKCTLCSKTVYATEKITVEDKEEKRVFHKTCLKCTHCQVTLSLGNYASMKGVFYCKPHFKQLFATKGNYDEGFGKEKHTAKWIEKTEDKPEERYESRAETPVEEPRAEPERQQEEEKRYEEPREEERAVTPVEEERAVTPVEEEERAVSPVTDRADEEDRPVSPFKEQEQEQEPEREQEQEETRAYGDEPVGDDEAERPSDD